MSKIIVVGIVLFLSACGVTKIDIPEPMMVEIREYYPEATSGYIIIKTKPLKKGVNNDVSIFQK